MNSEREFLEKTKNYAEKFDWSKKYAVEKLVGFSVSVLHSDDVKRESEKNIGI